MNKRYIDNWLIGAFFLLMLMGIIMVYSSSAFYAQKYFNDHLYFLKRHLFYLFIGLIAMAFAYSFPYQKIQGWTWGALFLGVSLLIYAAFVEGDRWINWGPIHFQAVDVAKFCLILFFADSLSRKEKFLHRYSDGLFPHLFFLVIFALLILRQPDFSSAFILVAIGITMLFVSTAKISQLVLTGVSLIPLMLMTVILSPYKWKRLLAFWNPEDDLQGMGYQVYQSLVSLGSGGITGVGFANSTQKMFFLPEAHTDFIFAIIGEEWGLLGTMMVVLVYGIILVKGIRIARRARDRFTFYLAIGITANFAYYAIINMMVTLRLLPATGLPLPFISYGGTALLFSCIYAGLLLKMAHQTLIRRPSTGIRQPARRPSPSPAKQKLDQSSWKKKRSPSRPKGRR